VVPGSGIIGTRDRMAEPEGLLQKPRVVCSINACNNRPMHIGARRVSMDAQHPEVQLAALHSLAGR
jgi:hypothetical protein